MPGFNFVNKSKSSNMDLAERDSIVAEVKAYYAEITGYSEKAALDDFLKSYDDAPDFLHISSDGTIRKAAAFKKVCSDYYNMLDHQKISTISQEIHIIG